MVDDVECYHVLYWLAGLMRPRTYLEVGVREGASLCCVLAEEPVIVDFAVACLMDGRTTLTPDIVTRIRDLFTNRDHEMQLYLFDNWSYEGGKGGHERLNKLLTEGFSHSCYCYDLFDGDSKETLPLFFNADSSEKSTSHPSIIDLVFVDGDHTREGAEADLENLSGRFRVLVMHDLFHPQHDYLEDVFKRYVRDHGYPHFIVGRHTMGTGVAFNLEAHPR